MFLIFPKVSEYGTSLIALKAIQVPHQSTFRGNVRVFLLSLLSGVLWQGSAPENPENDSEMESRSRLRALNSMSSLLEESLRGARLGFTSRFHMFSSIFIDVHAFWPRLGPLGTCCPRYDAKVGDLARRGVRLGSLLDFWASALELVDARSSTNDVVRQVIIPRRL